jgi:hypothetical protein
MFPILDHDLSMYRRPEEEWEARNRREKERERERREREERERERKREREREKEREKRKGCRGLFCNMLFRGGEKRERKLTFISFVQIEREKD